MTKPVSGWAIVHKKSGIDLSTIKRLRNTCIQEYEKRWTHHLHYSEDTWTKLRWAGYSCEKVTITLK